MPTTGLVLEANAEQKRLVRWILGVGNSASATGVIAEMGWQDIEYQVRRRRIMWKARVHHLKEDRWCKRMKRVEKIKEAGWSSPWGQIEKDQRELGVIEEDITSTK